MFRIQVQQATKVFRYYTGGVRSLWNVCGILNVECHQWLALLADVELPPCLEVSTFKSGSFPQIHFLPFIWHLLDIWMARSTTRLSKNIRWPTLKPYVIYTKLRPRRCQFCTMRASFLSLSILKTMNWPSRRFVELIFVLQNVSVVRWCAYGIQGLLPFFLQTSFCARMP